MILQGLHMLFCSVIVYIMLILIHLGNITGKKNLQKNYVNYETDIVAHHHITIDGWPIGIKFESLSDLKNLQDLRRLQDALKTTACKWVSMSQKQIDRHAKELERREAAGEVIKKKRQEWSDAHTTKLKNTSKGKKWTCSTDNNSETDEREGQEPEGSDGEESNDENQMPPRKHPRCSSKENATFRSRSVIDEEDSTWEYVWHLSHCISL